MKKKEHPLYEKSCGTRNADLESVRSSLDSIEKEREQSRKDHQELLTKLHDRESKILMLEREIEETNKNKTTVERDLRAEIARLRADNDKWKNLLVEYLLNPTFRNGRDEEVVSSASVIQAAEKAADVPKVDAQTGAAAEAIDENGIDDDEVEEQAASDSEGSLTDAGASHSEEAHHLGSTPPPPHHQADVWKRKRAREETDDELGAASHKVAKKKPKKDKLRCNFCTRRFRTIPTRYNHEQSHGVLPICKFEVCSSTPQTFSQNSAYRKHITRRHPKIWSIIKSLEDKIRPLIVPAILNNDDGSTSQTSVAGQRSTSSASSEAGAGGDTEPMDKLLKHLDNTATSLPSFGLDLEVIQQVFGQIFYWICARCLNGVLSRKDLCNRFNGKQIQGNVFMLKLWWQTWCCENKMNPDPEVTATLQPIIQACKLLQAKKTKNDINSLCELCDKLQVSQVVKLLKLYTPADELGPSVIRLVHNRLQDVGRCVPCCTTLRLKGKGID